MSNGLLWKDGRLGWPLVLAAAFSTFAILATDYAWRTAQAPLWLIVAAGIAVLLAGNAAILLIGARRR